MLVLMAARWQSAYLPLFIEDSVVAVLIFVVLFALAIGEMPLMVFAMQKMSASVSTPRVLLIGMNAAYVGFTSVYGALYLLATREFFGAVILAAVGVFRFASGIWIR